MTVILDCDPGNSIPKANVDDSLVIATLAGLAKPMVDLIVTVFGNTPAEIGYQCADSLLRQFNFECLLACGARRPLSGNKEFWADKLNHPKCSLTQANSVDLSNYDSAQVIATGPLTNIARAIQSGYLPQHVYLMGGAIGFEQLVDTNFAVDPKSAYLVFEADVPLTVVPLDVTRTTCWSLSDWERNYAQLSHRGAATADFIDSWLRPWIAHSQRTRPVAGMWIHDLVALVTYLEDIAFFSDAITSRESKKASVDCNTGKLYLEHSGREIELVTKVDNHALNNFIDFGLAGLC